MWNDVPVGILSEILMLADILLTGCVHCPESDLRAQLPAQYGSIRVAAKLFCTGQDVLTAILTAFPIAAYLPLSFSNARRGTWKAVPVATSRPYRLKAATPNLLAESKRQNQKIAPLPSSEKPG